MDYTKCFLGASNSSEFKVYFYLFLNRHLSWDTEGVRRLRRSLGVLGTDEVLDAEVLVQVPQDPEDVIEIEKKLEARFSDFMAETLTFSECMAAILVSDKSLSEASSSLDNARFFAMKFDKDMHLLHTKVAMEYLMDEFRTTLPNVTNSDPVQMLLLSVEARIKRKRWGFFFDDAQVGSSGFAISLKKITTSAKALRSIITNIRR